MSDALPLALRASFVVLSAAMPWHRPHPSHRFILKLLRSHLEGNETNSHVGDRKTEVHQSKRQVVVQCQRPTHRLNQTLAPNPF
jgi:hypothetical protein